VILRGFYNDGGGSIVIDCWSRGILDQVKIRSTFDDLSFKSSVFYIITPVLVHSENETEATRVTTYRQANYMAGEGK
jgi:hypothetical protein